ncbi:MAG: glycosyltransferase family 2 protein [Pirellulales bacterium]
MLRLSIIIPALGDWEALETTLVAVLQNRPPRSEVMVVTNATYADPYDLREEVQFVQGARRAGLVELVNQGVATARGEVLHLVCCGATVSDGWTDAALRHFRDSKVAAVAPLVVDSGCVTNVATAGSVWSPGGKWSPFGSGEQADVVAETGKNWIGPAFVAGFYRRSLLVELGAFDSSLPAELAAVDLGLRLRQENHRSLLEASSLLAMSTADLPHSAAFAHGWHSERLFWRHLGDQHSGGQRRLSRIAAHAGVVLTESLRQFGRPAGMARMLGRIVGACDACKARRQAPSLAATNRSPVTSADRRIDGPHEFSSPAHGPAICRPSAILFSSEETA